MCQFKDLANDTIFSISEWSRPRSLKLGKTEQIDPIRINDTQIIIYVENCRFNNRFWQVAQLSGQVHNFSGGGSYSKKTSPDRLPYSMDFWIVLISSGHFHKCIQKVCDAKDYANHSTSKRFFGNFSYFKTW